MSSDEQADWLQALVRDGARDEVLREFLDSLRYRSPVMGLRVYAEEARSSCCRRVRRPLPSRTRCTPEVGHHARWVQRSVDASSLDTRLESGETVEVVTSKSDKSGPSRDWLALFASPRARPKRLKAWFSGGAP